MLIYTYNFIGRMDSGHQLLNCKLGLGALTVERSFFPENERNNQERSHRSEKKRLERILKNIGMISKRTERNGTEIA